MRRKAKGLLILRCLKLEIKATLMLVTWMSAPSFPHLVNGQTLGLSELGSGPSVEGPGMDQTRLLPCLPGARGQGV